MNKYKSKYRHKKILRRRLVACLFCIIIAIVLFFILHESDDKEIVIGKKDKIVNSFELIDIVKVGVLPDNVYGVPVHTQLIPEDTDARPMTKRLIQYIVIHETDNFIAGVGAKNHANYLSYNNDTPTSWHYTVDDHEIYHHIPDDEIAHHAGEAEGNQHGIGIELCVNSDGNFEKTFDNGAKLVAYLLKAYDLTIDNVKTHHDFNGKDCPHYLLSHDRFDEFKNRVSYYLDQQ